MLKTNSLLIAASISLVSLISAPSVQAMMMQQSQSQQAEQSVTAEMNGSGTAKIESSQKIFQAQSQSMSEGWGNARINYGRANYHRPAATSADGRAYLGWDLRGGTCHVRYTENSTRNYKYSTSASCDNGGMTIGGLRPGWTYRFQVKKDDDAWSRPVRIKAS